MPNELWNILVNFWSVLGEMGPYLLFGFFAAGVLSVLISPEWTECHLGGLLLDQIITPQQITHAAHAGWMPAWVKHISAVVLLAVLVVGYVGGRKHEHQHENKT